MKSAVADLRVKGYRVRALSVDMHQTMARQYGVRSIPTFVYTKDGETVRKKSGRLSQEGMIKLCRDTWY